MYALVCEDGKRRSRVTLEPLVARKINSGSDGSNVGLHESPVKYANEEIKKIHKKAFIFEFYSRLRKV